jgi:acetyl-CoA carboxylase biotin carboxylase subunit
MGEVARKAAMAVGYVGAGTIEFLVDAKRNFYFMEMNTRLQVEHPVTEMVSSLDLVRMQIEIAQGKKLSCETPSVHPTGWAVEARVCAEDARRNFLPTPGMIRHFRHPGGPFVRTDTFVYNGFEITGDYDPMIAKVVAWGATRDEAIRRLDRALSEFTIQGCTTNTMFLRQMLNFDPFVKGDYDTSVVEKYTKNPPAWIEEEHKIVALLGAAMFVYEREQNLRARVVNAGPKKTTARSAWRTQGRTL